MDGCAQDGVVGPVEEFAEFGWIVVAVVAAVWSMAVEIEEIVDGGVRAVGRGEGVVGVAVVGRRRWLGAVGAVGEEEEGVVDQPVRDSEAEKAVRSRDLAVDCSADYCVGSNRDIDDYKPGWQKGGKGTGELVLRGVEVLEWWLIIL